MTKMWRIKRIGELDDDELDEFYCRYKSGIYLDLIWYIRCKGWQYRWEAWWDDQAKNSIQETNEVFWNKETIQ